MRNKLSDLNNHLFAQMERLSDESLTPEQLETELKRAKGMKDISTQILDNAKVTLKAYELQVETGVPSPLMIEDGNNK